MLAIRKLSIGWKEVDIARSQGHALCTCEGVQQVDSDTKKSPDPMCDMRHQAARTRYMNRRRVDVETSESDSRSIGQDLDKDKTIG